MHLSYKKEKALELNPLKTIFIEHYAEMSAEKALHDSLVKNGYILQ